MALEVLLWCIAALLVTGVSALALRRRAPAATVLVYCASLGATSLGLLAAGAALLAPASFGGALTLPVGLPWLGAHFRLDPLSAFFGVVINLGGLGASLFGLGYGRHEEAPGRVLPFFPAFLAGIDQRALAKASRLSLPTIQRMEASDGVIRGNVESLMKLIAALDRLGIELIGEGKASDAGGRGLRLKKGG